VINNKKLWSNEDIIFLKKHYATNGALFIHEQLGRSIHAIHNKASLLSLTYSKPKAKKICVAAGCTSPVCALDLCTRHYQQQNIKKTRANGCTRRVCLHKWTEAELAILRTQFPIGGKNLVASILQISKNVIKYKAHKLCLRYTKVKQLCAMPLCNNPAIYRGYCSVCRGLAEKHSITLIQYLALLNLQNNKCGICGKVETKQQCGKVQNLCVDHDHNTSAIRGLLCHNCNAGLGLLGDDLIVIQKNLTAYINNSFKFRIMERKSYVDKAKRRKDYPLYASFKINLEEYIFMLAQQHNVCGCCGQKENIKNAGKLSDQLSIDHVHNNWICRICGVSMQTHSRPDKCFGCSAHSKFIRPVIRGLLCGRCNRGIGKLGDNPPVILQNIAIYQENINKVQYVLEEASVKASGMDGEAARTEAKKLYWSTRK